MKTPKLGQIVVVTWEDSSRQIEWGYQRPPERAQVHKSIGWLVQLNPSVLTLRPNRVELDRDGDEQHCGDMTIPRRAVVAIEVIR